VKSFRVVPGLPTFGPPARPFPANFARTGREGYVVEFYPDTSHAWSGNFAPGIDGFTGVCLHPNGNDIVVIASGRGYIIEPHAGELKGEIGRAVQELWEISNPPGFVYSLQGLAFVRIGPTGVYWHTRRLSWDGFREIAFTSEQINGEAWMPPDGWSPFEVDLATGRSRGGSFGNGDPERWEKLART
jgi:hypothetical protein